MTKYEKAIEAINELFGDDSVSPEETRFNLESLQDEIQTLVDTLSGEEEGDE